MTRVQLTHPERVLWPDCGVTKGDLAAYYLEVAPFMLPHVAGRPLSLVRSPEGIDGARFFQKHPMRGSPAAIRAVPIRESKGVKDYMAIDDADGLVSLAQIGATEIHAWGSRVADLEHPDLLTFDLDPDPSVPWARTVAAAREIRARLGALGLESFAKTTGGKGVHVVVPLSPRPDWDEVRAFSHALVETLAGEKPGEYLATASKAARRGKIFLDYLRNGRGATAVCPFSTRARPGAPVATPVSWRELTARLDPARFEVKSVAARLARLTRDPWEGFAKLRQTLPAARERG